MAFEPGHKKSKGPRKRPRPPPPVVLGGKRAGRPTVYQDTMPETVFRLRLLGHTDEDLAEFLGISQFTLGLWCKKYPEFNTAYANGGEKADAEVAAKLREVALGYEHKATKIMLGPGGNVIKEDYIQRYPPSPAAAGLWLSNRQRARWRLKQPEDDKDVNVNIRIVGGLPDE